MRLSRNESRRDEEIEERINVLETRLSRQSGLSRGLFEEALKPSVSTTPTRRIVGTLTAHFLLSARIL
jgi:hypothetical protein